MLEGLYSAAAGLAAQQRRMDALANDVANVNTFGYKRVRVGFRDLIYQPAGRGAAGDVMTGSGSAATFVGRGLAQGALRQTEEPLDVAIEGPGYFQVRRGDGTLALTRDGSFRLDEGGRLTTSRGEFVVPGITVPRGTDASQVGIAADGRVTVGGRQVGRIQVVDVRAPGNLTALGDNLFLPTAASGGPIAAAGARLTQGALEASNVDLADAMVDMMDAQRGFELASKAIQMQDQMMGIANGVKR